MEPANASLPYSDPDSFLESDLPSFTTPNQPPIPRSVPFFSASPSPANLAFNPDDFLASPPQPPTSSPTHTYTPELKRRLFPASELLSSAPPTSLRKTPGLSQQTPGLSQQTPALSQQPLFPVPDLPLPRSPSFSSPKQIPVPPRPPTSKKSHKTKCNCKASRCLKLYCPCFAASGFCADTCTCKNCQNTRGTQPAVREARETVLARDPRAFEPKVSHSASALRDNIHSKGCNCRKGCAKNYCVCRELRVACGPRCTCSGPNGCLNGKTDAMEGRHVKDKAEVLLPVAKVGPSPSRFLTGLPPPRFSRMKQSSAQKRPKSAMMASSGGLESLLSPSFPQINVDLSPSMDLHSNIDDFRQVMDEDGFMTPFTLRRSFRSIGDLTATKDGKKPLSSVLRNRLNGSGFSAPLSVKRRISLEILDEPKQEAGIGENPSRSKPPAKKIRMHADYIDTKNNNHKSQEAGLAAVTDSKTPDQTERLSDIKFATSPTTGGKEAMPRLWGTQPLFGRQDKIEICRLPRILRVKMGAGKPLRKFNL